MFKQKAKKTEGQEKKRREKIRQKPPIKRLQKLGLDPKIRNAPKKRKASEILSKEEINEVLEDSLRPFQFHRRERLAKAFNSLAREVERSFQELEDELDSESRFASSIDLL